MLKETTINTGCAYIDLNDPDSLEISLIDIGHKLSMNSEESIATVGRVVKEFVPSFCRVLRHERDRDGNPGDLLNALLNMATLLLGMCAGASIKEGCIDMALEDLVKGFEKGLTNVVRQARSSRVEPKKVEQKQFTFVNPEVSE